LKGLAPEPPAAGASRGCIAAAPPPPRTTSRRAPSKCRPRPPPPSPSPSPPYRRHALLSGPRAPIRASADSTSTSSAPPPASLPLSSPPGFDFGAQHATIPHIVMSFLQFSCSLSFSFGPHRKTRRRRRVVPRAVGVAGGDECAFDTTAACGGLRGFAFVERTVLPFLLERTMSCAIQRVRLEVAGDTNRCCQVNVYPSRPDLEGCLVVAFTHQW